MGITKIIHTITVTITGTITGTITDTITGTITDKITGPIGSIKMSNKHLVSNKIKITMAGQHSKSSRGNR
jgi:hypothetical protein